MFSGESWRINYWFLDDLLLFNQIDHDANMVDIFVEPYYEQGSVMIPRALVNNFGLNDETFNCSCDIMIGQQSVYS